MRSFTANIEELFNFVEKKQEKGTLIDKGVTQYIIPLYQREFKWKLEKINTLINDVISRDKFLGIIIFDKNNNSYEIVDGQQRITTLVLALVALFNLYEGSPKEQESILKILKNNDNEWILRNDSIGDYLKEDNGRIILNISQKKDVYFQKDTFEEAYNEIVQILSEYNKKELKNIRNKILDSEMGVFVNEFKLNAHPIEQTFLDINEKSQTLDKENIFKGHCFKNYDNNRINELKNDWAELKKYGAQFKEINVDDLGHYIYLFLLITESNSINENLHVKGKHLLEDKTMDETAEVLKNMISFGKSNSSFLKQLRNVDYCFEDCCHDFSRYKNTNQHQSIKEVLYQVLSDTKALYQKLPLLYFIYYLHENTEMISEMKYDQFKRIISNIYVYSMIFVYSKGRKSKTNIDYTIRDALNESNDIKEVVKAAKELRKIKVKDFKISKGKHKPDYLKFIYGVIDNYNCQKSYVDAKYYKSDITLEHFVIPNNRKMKITYKMDEKTFDIEIDKVLGKQYKKSFVNYLLLEDELNGKLKSYDVKTKIGIIKEWYNNNRIPKHVKTYISIIEDMDEYRELLECDKIGDISKIKLKYIDFINAYFKEEFQDEIVARIKKEFENAFHNN